MKFVKFQATVKFLQNDFTVFWIVDQSLFLMFNLVTEHDNIPVVIMSDISHECSALDDSALLSSPLSSLLSYNNRTS